MEAIVEIVIQNFSEVFSELILTAIAKLIGLIFKKIDRNNLLRRRIKFVLTYILLGLLMTLIISSIMYSTRFLVIISLSYMFFQVVVTLLEIINEDKKSHPHIKSIRILKV